ncbi:MAG: DUF3784 domain-containing protein [Firmicutes bacterium]|nr:DUF3784 domain-containing protein [Bacillota bacterium]
MLVEALTCAGVGIVLAVLGVITWKKQEVKFLHSYHHSNVKKEDIPEYTKLMGIGQIVIGAGLCITGALTMFSTSKLVWAPFIAALIIGMAVMSVGQKKYNGSWFSLK